MCVCVRVQGCSESSVAVAAHPRIDMAVWHLSAFLNSHGLHLHHPQLPPGMNVHRHTPINTRCLHWIRREDEVLGS